MSVMKGTAEAEDKISSLDALRIGNQYPCFIIAEIGQNHQGELHTAKELIRLAKVIGASKFRKCGVDCVKFQKSSLSHRFTSKTLESPYLTENSFGSTYGEHRAHLEFTDSEFEELQCYAQHAVGIQFTASPMDIPSVDLLIKLKVPFIKIGSGDTNNFPLLEYVAGQKVPIILSTGMQDFRTVKESHDIIRSHHSELVVLHCVSSYPTLPSEVNLNVIHLYKKEFPQTVIGYSGHEQGINIAIAAVAHGAKVIEKHFTQNKAQKGTDHQCSLDPTEMENLVKGIREVEEAFGTPVKKIQSCEEACRRKLGKSLVTAKKLQSGTKLQLSDLAIKVSRPMGLRPEVIYSAVGADIGQTIEQDEPIQLNNEGQVVSAIKSL